MMRTPQKKMTCADVARKLGVSRALLSSVLHNSSATIQVSSETRKRLLDAVWENGIQLSRNIGVLVPQYVVEAEELYYPALAGISKRCAELQYGLLTSVMEDRLPEFLVKRNICGLLLWNEAPENLLSYLEGERIPFLMLNPQDNKCFTDAVVFNDYENMMELLEYLHGKGYCKFCYPAISSDIKQHDKNYISNIYAAYDDFLEAKKLAGIQYHDFDELESMVKNSTAETVFIAFSRLQTIRLLEFFARYYKKFPADGGVVGAYMIAEQYDPPITCLKYPFHEMGTVAVDMLLEKLAERKFHKGEKRTLAGYVQKKYSTGGEL